MAVTIVTTIGGAVSNSYATEAEFKTYCEELFPRADAYFDAEPDDLARALAAAARELNRKQWHGARVNATQALAWPRYGAAKADGVGYGYGLGYGESCDCYASDEIPLPVKHAQMELALAFLRSDYDPNQSERVTSLSADGVSVRKEFNGAMGELPPIVLRLLTGLLRSAEVERA